MVDPTLVLALVHLQISLLAVVVVVRGRERVVVVVRGRERVGGS